jgi:putative PIN family toxin of toxin-antitoxin system
MLFVQLFVSGRNRSRAFDTIFGIKYNTIMIDRVVIDTNVVVSSLRSADGASFALIRLVGSGKFELSVSVPLVLEYEHAAKQTLGKTGITEKDIESLIDDICSLAHRKKVFFLWRPDLKDPKDEHVLELAVASNSRYLITFNKKDFVGAEQFGIELLTPQEYLREIGAKP